VIAAPVQLQPVQRAAQRREIGRWPAVKRRLPAEDDQELVNKKIPRQEKGGEPAGVLLLNPCQEKGGKPGKVLLQLLWS